MLHKDQENEAAVEFNSKRDEIRTKNLEGLRAKLFFLDILCWHVL